MSSSWAVFSGIEWIWPDLTPAMLMLYYQNHALICACMRVCVYVYVCLLCLQKSQQALWGGNFDLLVLPHQFLPPSTGRRCQNVLAYFLEPGRCLAISGEQINMCEWGSEPIRGFRSYSECCVFKCWKISTHTFVCTDPHTHTHTLALICCLPFCMPRMTQPQAIETRDMALVLERERGWGHVSRA